MIKIGCIDVWGFEHAIRGMRNALESHKNSDSFLCDNEMQCEYCDKELPRCGGFYLGENDLALMKKLCKAGTEHRKMLRTIYVSLDITAPDYFFKQFSTYKVGTTELSTSTMHTIHKKSFSLEDFSYDGLTANGLQSLKGQIEKLNELRDKYEKTKDNDYWLDMIKLLPMSYNYTRTVTINYENVLNMINQRSTHKLKEWRDFTDFLRELPYVRELLED